MRFHEILELLRVATSAVELVEKFRQRLNEMGAELPPDATADEIRLAWEAKLDEAGVLAREAEERRRKAQGL